MQYGLKRRLAKIEQAIQEQLEHEAKRYNKSFPGKLIHFDTERPPFLKGQSARDPCEYLFVAIDDFSRELYTGIFPVKPSAVQLVFSLPLSLPNVLIRSTAHTPITVRNLKELTIILSAKLAD